jgi:hypothetical protein
MVLLEFLWIKKIIKDFGFIDLESYLRKSKLSNEEKLLKYFEKIN